MRPVIARFSLIFLLSCPRLFSDAATAHNPIIVFDNLTGSDTAASGSPADLTAIFAAATCHTNGVATTTIQWPANGFLAAGVPTGFLAVVWIKAAAGRQWSEINTYAANTVTVEDNFNIPAGTPVDCAVGGLRRTIDGSAQLFPDVKGGHTASVVGWFVQLTPTGSNYTTSANRNFSTATQGCDFSTVGCSQTAAGCSSRAVVEATGNFTLLTAGNCNVHGLQFINTSAAKAAAHGIDRGASNFNQIFDNIIGGTADLTTGFQQGLRSGTAIPNDGSVWANEVRFNVVGVNCCGAIEKVLWNYIHDNTTGMTLAGFANHPGFIWRNLIVNNTGDAININAGNNSMWIIENTIDGNGGDGVDCAGNCAYIVLVNNQLTNNTGFGVNCTSGTAGCNTTREDVNLVAWNNFFNNTAGARNNFLVGESETASNPGYINRAAKNYCIPDNANNRGGPPGPPPATYRGTLTQSLILKGACQPIGGAGANLGI